MLKTSNPSIGTLSEGCKIRILNSPNQAGQHEVHRLAFQLKGSLDSAPRRPKAKEQVMVISGVLEITSVENNALVHPSDTACYDASCPHATQSLNGHAMASLIVENS